MMDCNYQSIARPAMKAFNNAIDAASSGRPSYPNGTAFVSSDLPNLREVLLRYARERRTVVVVSPDGVESIIGPEDLRDLAA